MTEANKTAENYSTAEKLAMKGVPWPVAKQMADAVNAKAFDLSNNEFNVARTLNVAGTGSTPKDEPAE